MSNEQEALDRLLRAAGRAPVPSDPRRDARLAEAEAAAFGRERRRRARSIGVGVALAAAAVVLLALWTRSGEEASPVVAAPTTDRGSPPTPVLPGVLVLPSGDRVATGPDARIAILDASDASRRITLDVGTAVFDVTPLGQGHSFTVRTPHLIAEVVGTVFRVDVGAGGTRVATLEGRVRITEDDREVFVDAGETHSSVGWAERDARVDMGSFVEGALARREPASSAGGREASATEAPSEAAGGDRLVAATVEEARRLLAERRYDEVLAMSARADQDDADWLLLAADAARASGRPERAAESFERAIDRVSPTHAARIGLQAAQLRADLTEPARALELLRRSRASEAHSPVEERALVLEARVLLELGRETDASALARRYLTRFPGGADRGHMERLASDGR